MNNFSSLGLSAILGLIAGISHGMVSHYMGLPVSLSEQLTNPLSIQQSFED